MSAALKMKEIVDGRGITYTFISDKTGIPIDTISRIFLNKRRFMADEMIKICAAIGVDLNEFASDQKVANQ